MKQHQCNAQGIALHLCQLPPHPIFISTIIIRCYATLPLMSLFQSSFVAIIFIAFLFALIIYCYSPLFSFFLCVEPSIMLSVSFLLAIQHISTWYLIALAQFIVLSNLPYSVSLIISSLAFHPYFLPLGCSIICSLFILLPLCPILCTWIVIVFAVFFILFARVTPAYVVVTQLPLNCFG